MLFRKQVVLPDYVQVRRKAVKYARIRITNEAQVELTVPGYYHHDDIVELLQRKQQWIENKRQLSLHRQQQQPQFHVDSLLWQGQDYAIRHHARRDDLFSSSPIAVVHSRHALDTAEARSKWYRRKAREVLSQRLDQLAKQHQLDFQGISIRDQKTRWGSCSSSGNISLNWRLILAPREVCDYVLIHELAHTRYMNHSRDFWQLVATMEPEYQRHRQWLRQFGQGLMGYLQPGSSP